jgi:hypothetical protein
MALRKSGVGQILDTRNTRAIQVGKRVYHSDFTSVFNAGRGNKLGFEKKFVSQCEE